MLGGKNVLLKYLVNIFFNLFFLNYNHKNYYNIKHTLHLK